MAKLKVAIVGTNIGCKLHVDPLRAAGFEVAALIGQDPQRTRERAAAWKIPNVSSLDAALDSDIDAIVVATPPETHHDIVLKAVSAGKHILCEKPFALDVGQAKEMLAAVEQAGLAHLLVHGLRWFVAHALTRKIVREGGIGEMLQGRFEFDHSLLLKNTQSVPDWWRYRERGGGWLRNYNAHGLDDLRYIAGEIASVCAVTHADPSRGFTADDSYIVNVVLKNGAQAVMAGSARSVVFHNQSRIIGTKGVIRFDWRGFALQDDATTRSLENEAEALASQLGEDDDPAGLVRATLRDEIGQPPSPGFGHAQQIALSRAFHRRIADPAFGHPSIADFSDGVVAMQLLEAIERSVVERRWIDLP